MMSKELTITKYRNGITVSVSCTGTNKIFEDEHCLAAMKFIVNHISDDYCIAIKENSLMGESGILNSDILACKYRLRSIIGPGKQKLPTYIEVYSLGDGFIMCPNPNAENAIVYEADSVQWLILDLCALCFPEIPFNVSLKEKS